MFTGKRKASCRNKFLNFTLLDFTFPNSDHLPAFLRQFFCNCFVSGFVALDLVAPVCGVVRGSDVAAVMSMPETAVGKNGDSILGEDKIGMTRKFRVSAPADDMMMFENPNQLQFRGLVAF